MNKTKLSTLLISATILVGGLFAYGEMKAISLPRLTAGALGEVTTVTTEMRMSGLVRYIGIDSSAVVTNLSISTVSGSGSSISAAKSIVDREATTDLATNLTAVVWLYNDFISATISNGPGGTVGSTHDIIILITDP